MTYNETGTLLFKAFVLLVAVDLVIPRNVVLLSFVATLVAGYVFILSTVIRSFLGTEIGLASNLRF